MENAGESMDDAVEETKDAINPDGPMEEAGESMDDAMDDDS